MPVVFAPLIGLTLGACFAWVAAPEIERHNGPTLSSRAFALVAAFAGFVWLPVVGYFLAFHGDWSYLYLVPWRRIPSAVDLVLALVAAASVLTGFAASVHTVRKRRSVAVLCIVGLPIVLVLAAMPFVAHRLAISATYAQFQGDFGIEPVPGSLLGRGVLAMGLILVASLAWMVRCLLRLASDADK